MHEKRRKEVGAESQERKKIRGREEAKKRRTKE